MGSVNSSGIYQLTDGMWGYRITFFRDGKRFDKRFSKNSEGLPLKTKTAAVRARQEALEAIEDSQQRKPIPRKTLRAVYDEYRQIGRKDKAYKTVLKQDSLWDNHLKNDFGEKYIDELTVAEINDYLSRLYYDGDYSYQYVESFLKMFYLILGQAYDRNYMDSQTYNTFCKNKGTKIRMPKQKSEDETDIKIIDREDLVKLDEYFQGTNAETAYLLGRYCGLRINETFGLKWDHVDLQKGTILIDRQMQYQDSLIKLVAPKTKNSNRTVYMCETLWNHLKRKKSMWLQQAAAYSALRQQNQRMIEDIDGKLIPSTELVNCLYDGKIQTVNSFKYPTREIKSKLHIDFKYHYLRHTYGTMMAEMNTPAHLLCNQMGHGNIHVTQRYYLAISKTGIEIIQNNINRL